MRRRPDRRCPKNQENRGGFKVFAERPQMTNKSTTNRLWTGKTPSALILKTFSWLSTQRGMDGLVKASAGILSCLIAIDAPRPVQRLSWTAAASLQPLFWWLMVNNFLLLPLHCLLSVLGNVLSSTIAIFWVALVGTSDNSMATNAINHIQNYENLPLTFILFYRNIICM